MSGEMTREERVKMLAHIWTAHLWPEKGDVKALTLAMRDDEEVGMGLTVFGFADLDDLVDCLVEALLGEERIAPAWMALTATVFFDTMDKADAEKLAARLGEQPTPTTRHGLMVLIVDREGCHSTCWQMDLEPKITLPEQPVWDSDEEPEGHNLQVMRLLFDALVEVGEQP